MKVGSGGASGLVTDDSESFRLDNMEFEVVGGARTGRPQCITCCRNTVLDTLESKVVKTISYTDSKSYF